MEQKYIPAGVAAESCFTAGSAGLASVEVVGTVAGAASAGFVGVGSDVLVVVGAGVEDGSAAPASACCAGGCCSCFFFLLKRPRRPRFS
jgi:hypothetical protein